MILKKYPIFISLKVRMIVLAWIGCFSLLISCSSEEKSENEKSVGVNRVPKLPNNVDAEVDLSAHLLSKTLQLRRIYLDVLHQLPPTELIEKIESGEVELKTVIKEALDKPQFAKAISRSHAKIWGLESSSLPVLKQFRKIDLEFAQSLTPDLERSFKDEPLNYLRGMVESNEPMNNIFGNNLSYGTKDFVNFIELDEKDKIWSDESVYSFSYSNSRSKLGLLSTVGIHSVYSETGDSGLGLANKVLNQFFCMDLRSQNNHDFSEFFESKSRVNLLEQSTKNVNCAGCHKPLNDLAEILLPLSQGESFSELLTVSTTELKKIYYLFGTKISNYAELSKFLNEDTLFHNCEIKKVMEFFLHRDIELNDYQTYSVMYDLYRKNNFNLKPSLEMFLQNNIYLVGSLGSGVDFKTTINYAGIKLLNNIQIKSIFDSFLKNNDLDVSESVSLNLPQHGISIFQLSQGEFFWQYKKVVSNFTRKLVSAELADGVKVSDRSLLKILPEGLGVSEDESIAIQQILSLWQLLTSKKLTKDDPRIQELLSMWKEIFKQPNESVELKTTRAWRLILTAIFISPEFYMY